MVVLVLSSMKTTSATYLDSNALRDYVDVLVLSSMKTTSATKNGVEIYEGDIVS